jgi:ABC-type antimicrobial peptide transport system permease subunit
MRSLPLPTVRLLKVDFYERAQGNRGARILTIAIALLTLAVACLGILGLVSYGIKVRRKEIAIRVALGARTRSIALIMIRRLVWPVGLGMFIGIAGTRFGASYVVPETLIDVAVMTVVASIVLVTTASAALLPGLRASRGNCLDVLRCE